jgi:hypothetical protein
VPYTVQGTTTNFIVQYDTAMGAFGVTNAVAILNVCEAQYSSLSTLFSGITIPTVPITVQIENLTGGATNNLTNFIDIKAGNDPYQCQYLLVAELAEMFMHIQGTFWNPANSKGEGLSRLLAANAFPISGDLPNLNQYLTGNFWMNNARPDFVTINDPSDHNPASTGCAIMFLYYLFVQLGHSLSSIVNNTATTLDLLFHSFSGMSGAFSFFTSQLAVFYPLSIQVPSTFPDNPFPLSQVLTKGGIAKPLTILGSLTGTNGSDGNPFFTLSAVPLFLNLFKNGQLMYPGVAYNLIGNVVSFISPYVPLTTDLLEAIDL